MTEFVRLQAANPIGVGRKRGRKKKTEITNLYPTGCVVRNQKNFISTQPLPPELQCNIRQGPALT